MNEVCNLVIVFDWTDYPAWNASVVARTQTHWAMSSSVFLHRLFLERLNNFSNLLGTLLSICCIFTVEKMLKSNSFKSIKYKSQVSVSGYLGGIKLLFFCGSLTTSRFGFASGGCL